MSKVIKPLIWYDEDSGCRTHAHAPGFIYAVGVYGTLAQPYGARTLTCLSDPGTPLKNEHNSPRYFATVKEAKDACQQVHERRLEKYIE